jgi:DNA-binding NarL/FixJ family response regulator
VTTRPIDDPSGGPLGLIWIDCPYPLVSLGLAQTLKGEARIHFGRKPPKEDPPLVIFAADGTESLPEGVKRIRKQSPSALIIVLGLYFDLAAAEVALRAGARDYIHAGMKPEQIRRVVKVTTEGRLAAPRQLLEYLISSGGETTGLDILSKRQREILNLVGEGLTNLQIAKRIFLTESTVKQHLRAVYKALGVSNRTEAIRLLRNGD